jgi:hypothetical protein
MNRIQKTSQSRAGFLIVQLRKHSKHKIFSGAESAEAEDFRVFFYLENTRGLLRRRINSSWQFTIQLEESLPVLPEPRLVHPELLPQEHLLEESMAGSAFLRRLVCHQPAVLSCRLS